MLCVVLCVGYLDPCFCYVVMLYLFMKLFVKVACRLTELSVLLLDAAGFE